MTRVVADASALAALVFQEPEADRMRSRLEGAAVFVPMLLKFELANIARKKAERQPRDAVKIMAALTTALHPEWGLIWEDIDAADVVLLARATGLSTYDAAYLWLAGSLGADLVTLDRTLARANGSDEP